jgi:hypothetical protein
MPVDLDYLRQHYASLSDEALEAIDPRDLVEAARACYDEELRKRSDSGDDDAVEFELPDSDDGDEDEDSDEDPAWIEDGSIVYSNTVFSATAPAPDAANARDVLEAAGIPCHLELVELPEEDHSAPPPTHQWRVLVPGQLNMRATSVLERDIFNADFEAEWKAHLEVFSDRELRAMNPKTVFCGLFDRIERATRAYNEELSRRKL